MEIEIVNVHHSCLEVSLAYTCSDVEIKALLILLLDHHGNVGMEFGLMWTHAVRL